MNNANEAVEEACKFAWNCLYDFIDELQEPCVDNHRVALVGNAQEEEAYLLQAEEGCCGTFETEVVDPVTGFTFWLGCNYGH